MSDKLQFVDVSARKSPEIPADPPQNYFQAVYSGRKDDKLKETPIKSSVYALLQLSAQTQRPLRLGGAALLRQTNRRDAAQPSRNQNSVR
jgi:hypothetical protein